MSDGHEFEETWDVLASSLREIHTKNASKLSFEQLYRNAYKLVLRKKGEQLYNNVHKLEQEWLENTVRPRILRVLPASLLVDHTTASTSENANELRIAGERLMRALRSAWEDHILCMGMTTDVLMYLVCFDITTRGQDDSADVLKQDRVYCQENNRPCVFPFAMGLFRDYVLREPIPAYENTSIVTVLVSVILAQVRMEREGDVIDKALIRSCIYMFEGLYEDDDEYETAKLYLTTFEPAFLSASRDFYRTEGQKLLRNIDAGSYCRHTMKRLGEESDRCRTTLAPMTWIKIREVVEKELIQDNIREAIQLPGSGVQFMLDNSRMEELTMIYDLNARVDPKTKELMLAVQKRIVELGTEINASAKADALAQPVKVAPPGSEKTEKEAKAVSERSLNQQTAAAIQWVDDVLQLKDKYDGVLKNAFKEDQNLQTAFTRSFAEFINAFDRISEYLSLFFDENMKKGIKGKTETEVDVLLDKGILLLRYVQDKDMFERYYKKHLSRRLLMKRSVSMDAERQMISKMKLEVGNTFTQRIEAMFKDMTISEELTSTYKRHVENLGDRDTKRAEMDVNVLTSTVWPLEAMGSAQFGESNRPSCTYPASIDLIKQGFEAFYYKKHTGRKLTWQANMGTADIRAYFPKSKSNVKTRELNVSTYAMLILLLFNEVPSGESLTCEEIQARTNIPIHDLTRNLQSLAVAPKTRVLVKEPMSKDVKLSDKFSFNESFHSQFNKIKIGVVSNANRVEDLEERRKTEKRNDDSRGGSIEAAIVRIMK